MEDGRALAHYLVHPGSVIHVVLRLPGAGCDKHCNFKTIYRKSVQTQWDNIFLYVHVYTSTLPQKKCNFNFQIFTVAGFPPSGKIRESQGEFYFSGKSGKVREFNLSCPPREWGFWQIVISSIVEMTFGPNLQLQKSCVSFWEECTSIRLDIVS